MSLPRLCAGESEGSKSSSDQIWCAPESDVLSESIIIDTLSGQAWLINQASYIRDPGTQLQGPWDSAHAGPWVRSSSRLLVVVLGPGPCDLGPGLSPSLRAQSLRLRPCEPAGSPGLSLRP